jgi:diguanylate cyclase (GGDEF)-like protein/PAS domain S-box-containing protein
MPGFQEPAIYRSILESLQTGVYVVNEKREIVFWNDGAERITGYLRHETVGHLCTENILMHCDQKSCDLCGEVCPLASALHESRPREGRVFLRHKAGHRVPVHIWAVPVRDQRGSIIGAAESIEEVTAIPDPDRRENMLAAYGCTDPVTGVANHAVAQAHLRESLATFFEVPIPFGILCVQLDELDTFRARYGQKAATAMLRLVAQTVESSLRPGDFLGRWSDHQFLVILLNCDGAALSALRGRVSRMVSSGGIQWWGQDLPMQVSLAQASAQAGDTVASILQRAQQSLPGSTADASGKPVQAGERAFSATADNHDTSKG